MYTSRVMTPRSSIIRSFDISGVRWTSLEVEADQLLLVFGAQVRNVHDDREPVDRRLRQWKCALPQLDRVHRRDREAERRQFVGHLADGDGAFLEPFEERTLRLQRDAVDLVEQDDLRRRQRSELGDEGAGGRIDHLKADDFGGLQVGAPLNTGEFRCTDGGENHAEECLADAGNAAQQQVARIDLPF